MSIAGAFGNVAQDPFISRNPAGKITLAKFTLVEDVYSSRGKSIVYIDCVAFGRMAEIVEQYVKKGTEVYIEGSFVSGQYKADDGRNVYTRNVRVDRLKLPSTRRASNETADSSDSSSPEIERKFEPLPFLDDADDEYPFYNE